jgi:transposase-like protein
MSKAKKTDTDQRQFWQMVLETFKTSGLSVRQFCKQEGLSEPSFYSWRKRLSVPQKSGPAKEPTPSDSFIQVSVPAAKPGALELILASGHKLHIPSDIDPVFLTGVLSAVKQAKLC